MNFHPRTGTVGGPKPLRMAVLFALFVGAAALFASLAAQDADARGSSSSSGSKSSSSSSSGSKASVSSSSKSKASSSSGSGLKYKAKKHEDFDCDEDDGCLEDGQAGQSDGSGEGWMVLAVVVLGALGVGAVGTGVVGYVGWRFYCGWSLRGDRPAR